MTEILGLLLLLLIVAIALDLLFSHKVKAALCGFALILLLGCIAPVIVSAFWPMLLRGVGVVLVVLLAIAVITVVMRLLVELM